jgi:cyclopropane-fatty-acyl-phospholipid synthase
MRKYMYPNSCLPSTTALITAATSFFTLQSVENHSKHYPRTLYDWAERLEKNLTKETVMSSNGYLPMPSEVDFDFATFKRKWRYFFAYAGAGFEKGYITNHMLAFSRLVSESLSLCDSIPRRTNGRSDRCCSR